LLALAAPARFAAAQPAEEDAVASAVEAFRKAMQANDRAGLDALCSAQLSYGHSDGKVQTKEVFLDDATSGKAALQAMTQSPASSCRAIWKPRTRSPRSGSAS
jgi:hypothetical protein